MLILYYLIYWMKFGPVRLAITKLFVLILIRDCLSVGYAVNYGQRKKGINE